MAKTRKKPRRAEAGPAVPPVEAPSEDGAWLVSPQFGLRLLVFVAGGVLMGLEIVGSRVLAPHFGNSVFVWGSLISVFLTALAAGYYLGGRLVDRWPSPRLLCAISIAASAWIFILASVAYRICEGLSQSGLGEQLGPLVASAILFLPPSVALGIVSPFSIRIAATSIRSIGQLAGTLYALSTTGSIAGTLLTTFVLIPAMGVTAILRLLGASMLLVSIVALPIPRNLFGRAAVLAAIAFAAGSAFISARQVIPLRPHERVLHDEHTPYHHLTIVQNDLAQTRELRFDESVESGIFLKQPFATSQVYPNYFQLAFLARPEMQNVLFIGAGGGSGPRAFLAHESRLKIDVVDIDRRVLQIAREYFFLAESPAIRLVAQDGRMYLRNTSKTYDCIVLDAFTIGGRIPFHLVTREYLELCRRRLTPNGLFVVNIGSALEGPIGAVFRSMYRTLGAVFPNVYVFARDHREAGMTRMTNIILIASNDANVIAESQWKARAKQYRPDPHVSTALMVKMVDDQIFVQGEDETVPIFTDDFAAIELMPM